MMPLLCRMFGHDFEPDPNVMFARFYRCLRCGFRNEGGRWGEYH
jgi:hypothetical protein